MRIATLGFILCFLPGCMSIFRGTTQGVWLTSDPPGAFVLLDGQDGVTPCLGSLDRSSSPVTVRFQMEGREPIEQDIVPHCDGGLLAAEFLWTIFGGLIDLASGSAYSWPYGLHATLAPMGGTSALKQTLVLPKTPKQLATEQQRRREEVEAKAAGRSGSY